MDDKQADLEKMFADAVAAFNKHDIAALEKYLDEQAIVYSKDGHKGYHPKHAASVYLNAQFTDKPNFQPLDVPAQFNTNRTGAVKHGTTTWRDTNRPNGEQIVFSFSFVYKNNRWLFSTLWAA
jgi:uncharacterized protein DUF4440